jgi:hypothetical protein
MEKVREFTEDEKKVYNKFDELLSSDPYDLETEEGVELYETTLRANEFYSKMLEKYLKSNIVIQFNLIQHIKANAKNFKDLADMQKFVWNIIETLNDKLLAETITDIEKKELNVANRFYKKVVLGKGKMYDITKNLKFEYDDETIDFEPIVLATEDKE